MRLSRLLTSPDALVLHALRWRVQMVEDWVEYAVPQAWGSAAAETLIAKVFYKGAVPSILKKIPEEGVPEWLWRSEADTAALDAVSAEWRFTAERDFAAVSSRIAGGITYAGWKAGLFVDAEEARIFHDEFLFLFAHQAIMPETALLAPAGLFWAYGLAQEAFVPAATIGSFSDGACATLGIGPRDSGHQDLCRLKIKAREAALEDRKITAVLPVENMDSAAFMALHRDADIRAAAAETGRRVLEEGYARLLQAEAGDREAVLGQLRDFGISDGVLRRMLTCAAAGQVAFETVADEEDDGLALFPVVSLPDVFIESAMTGHSFSLQEEGQVKRNVSAARLWEGLCDALWSSGAPAVFFRDSAPSFTQEAVFPAAGGAVSGSGASIPAVTLNLLSFRGSAFVDAEKLAQAAHIAVLTLEASSCEMKMSLQMQRQRPLAIGFTNLAALLMGEAIAYDSAAGRTAAGLVTALVAGAAQRASAEIASRVGPAPDCGLFAKEILQDVKAKMAVLAGLAHVERGMLRKPLQIEESKSPDPVLPGFVRRLWQEAYDAGRASGFRHLHLTAVDTDAAVQCLLGAQTPGMGPETALVRFEGYFSDTLENAALYGKKLNPAVPRALQKLGYGPAEIDDVFFYTVGHGTLLDAPHVNHAALKSKGFCQAALDALESALKTAQHIRYAFNRWTLGADFCQHVLGFPAEDLDDGAFDMLSALGFSEREIEAANLYCCGTMRLEGAPHIQPEHLAVFDILPPAYPRARGVTPEAVVRMQAAVESFLSGHAENVVALSHYGRVEDVQRLLLLAWELGVKKLRIYRDQCALLQPVTLPLEEEQALEKTEPAAEKIYA